MALPVDHPFNKTRLDALSDGVFAVALTILVVNVSNAENIDKISERGFLLFVPMFFSLSFSFVVIGMYWVAHHNEMNLIERPDRPFLWLNLLFLLFIVCIPFSAAFLGRNWSWNWTFDESPFLEQRKGVLLYSGNLFLAGIMLQALWRYARTRKNRHGNWLLLKKEVKDNEAIETAKRNRMAPIASVSVFTISLISPAGGECAIIFVPAIYVFWSIRSAMKDGSRAGRPD